MSLVLLESAIMEIPQNRWLSDPDLKFDQPRVRTNGEVSHEKKFQELINYLWTGLFDGDDIILMWNRK